MKKKFRTDKPIKISRKIVKKIRKNHLKIVAESKQYALDEYSSSAGYGGWGHDE